MTTTQPQEFNKFQKLIFPIHKHELKKFLPMSFLMFFILFVYTLVRDLKDIFVQYSTHLWVGAKPEESANLLSALKLWYVLPCAFLAVLIFTKLMNKFSAKKTFYIIILSFMVFYAVYGFILYPNLNSLLMSPEQISAMTNSVPTFFKSLLTCLGNWPITLFYVFSEIWGTMAISSLFWQFANATTMKHEVKRFFALFSVIGNLGVMVAAGAVKGYAKNFAKDPAVVPVLMTCVLLVGAAILATYAYINNVVLKDPTLYDPSQIKSKKKKKEKVNAMEGIRILFKTPYLLLIAVLVIGYGIAINSAEVIVKAGMKEAFGPEKYADMQGNISLFTAIFTIIMAIVGTHILRKLSWKTAALITPAAFLIIGGTFFVLALYKQFVSTTLFGISTMIMAAWFGIIFDALCKSIKYSLFDTTKNMAYLPLDEDTKTKGQAAVEVIGGRLGKAGSSAIQQVMIAFPKTLVTATGSVAGVLAYAPMIAVIFVLILVIWIFSIFKLSPKYEAAVREAEEDSAEAAKDKEAEVAVTKAETEQQK